MAQIDWEMTLKTLKQSVPEVQYQNWVKPLRLLRSTGNSVVLGVPNRFHQEWIETHYSAQLAKALHAQPGVQLELEFEISLQEQNERAAQSEPKQAPLNLALEDPKPALRVIEGQRQTHGTPSKLPENSPSEPEAEEENQAHPLKIPEFPTPFWELPGNRIAYQCGKMVSTGEGLPMNPLVIVAGVGMGKTHLLCEIAKHARLRSPKLRIRYVTGESFTNEFVRGIQNDGLESFKKKYRDHTDLLLFDDLEVMAKRDRTQEQLVHVFNDILTRGGQVVFASATLPHQLRKFVPTLQSRLASGVIAEIKDAHFEERVLLLKKVAVFHRLDCDDALLRSLASQGQKDNRELVASLVRLHLQSKLENCSLDHQFLAEKSWVPEPEKQEITIDEIISLVEQTFRVSRVDLFSKSRKSLINWSRQVAMFLARHYTLLPLEKIGSYFDRDHATVIHAHEKVRKSILSQPSKRYQVEFLMGKLSARSGKPVEPLPL